MTVQTRLEDQFALKTGEPLAPTFRRILKALEIRFVALEEQRLAYEDAVLDFKRRALAEVNVKLLPASEQILGYATSGFLVARSETPAELIKGERLSLVIDEGPVRGLFLPTLFVGIQHEEELGNFATAHVESYAKDSGVLTVKILSTYGDPGPFAAWVISAAPGISEITGAYFDRAYAAAQLAAAAAAKAQADRPIIEDSATALGESGINTELFAWRDGSRPFTAVITTPVPDAMANDASIPTTRWTRRRIAEGVAALSTGAPAALNSLAKLAAAIGNDPNFIANTDAKIDAKYDQWGGWTWGSVVLPGGGLTVNGMTVNGDLLSRREDGSGIIYLGHGAYIICYNGNSYHTHMGEILHTGNLNPAAYGDNVYNRGVPHANNFINAVRMVYGHDVNIWTSQAEWGGAYLTALWYGGSGQNWQGRYRYMQYGFPNGAWYSVYHT
jgi:hypothetical protein